MRKTILALSVAAAAGLSTTASAQSLNYPAGYGAAIGAGAVTGTIVGLGFAEGWFGNVGATLATTGGAATAGGIAGIATVVFLHSISTPCQGFLIAADIFNPGASACGQAAPPARRR